MVSVSGWLQTSLGSVPDIVQYVAVRAGTTYKRSTHVALSRSNPIAVYVTVMWDFIRFCSSIDLQTRNPIVFRPFLKRRRLNLFLVSLSHSTLSSTTLS